MTGVAIHERADLDPSTPLSARSVALSLLLGSHPPRLSARQLTALGVHFGIAAGTMRTALSRLTAAGDLVQHDATYTLSPRHLERQAATDALIRPRIRPYDGTWRMAIVTDRGRPAADRTALRQHLDRARFAELREGVWLRPDNLAEPDPAALADLRVFTTTPAQPAAAALAAELWDLAAWAAQANRLKRTMADRTAPPVHRLTAAAAAVRHLRTDPALPAELAPTHWPADELRTAYDAYRIELTPIELTPQEKP